MSLDTHENEERPVVRGMPRRYVALGFFVLIIILLGALAVIRNVDDTNDTSDVESITPAPTPVMAAVTGVPTATIDAVGVSSPNNAITPPMATGNQSLWQSSSNEGDPRPVVFFYGAEFAPYAAAERWPLIVALSRFGSFGPLGLMQSSSSVAFSLTSTFTFWHAHFSSRWLDLQTVERYSSLDPTGIGYMTLQTPTPRQAASVAIYDTSSETFPLLDIANHYVLVGSSFSPAVLAGMSQSQIASDLAYPTSPVTQAVVASANEITAAICTVTGQRPTAVCTARGVRAADGKMDIHPAR